jgi:hypothetical protein
VNSSSSATLSSADLIEFMKSQSSAPAEVSVLPRNDSGNDFVVSDPHGHLESLGRQIQSLGERDRLFICGDLVDRGPDSLKLIQTLIQEKMNGKHIFCVRGNHEDMVLKVVKFAAFLRYVSDIPDLDNLSLQQKRTIPLFLECLFGKGVPGTSSQHCYALKQTQEIWTEFLSKFKYGESGYNFFDHFTRHASAAWRLISLNAGELSKYDECWHDCVQLVLNGGKWLFDLSVMDVGLIERFMTGLPYVIRVEGEFDVVHAAPLCEEALQCAIDGASFTEAQIFYMTWARPPSFLSSPNIVHNGRSPGSLRVYVGHNSLSSDDPLYAAMNLINLDAGTFDSGATFIVNHTQNSVVCAGGIGPEQLEDCTISLAAIQSLMGSPRLPEVVSPVQPLLSGITLLEAVLSDASLADTQKAVEIFAYAQSLMERAGFCESVASVELPRDGGRELAAMPLFFSRSAGRESVAQAGFALQQNPA